MTEFKSSIQFDQNTNCVIAISCVNCNATLPARLVADPRKLGSCLLMLPDEILIVPNWEAAHDTLANIGNVRHKCPKA